MIKRWTPHRKPVEGQNCELTYTVTKSSGLLSLTASFRGPEVLAKRMITTKKTSLLPPSSHIRQVTLTDKMLVEDSGLLGDECYRNRKCSYIVKHQRMASPEVITVRQRIDKIISFPFFRSLAKSFSVI